MEIGSSEIAAFTGLVTALATGFSALSNWKRDKVQYHAKIKQLSDGNCLLSVTFSGFAYVEKISVNNGLIRDCNSSWYANQKEDWMSAIDLGIQLGPNMTSLRLFLVKPFGSPKEVKFYIHSSDRFFSQRLLAQWEEPDAVGKSDMLDEAEKEAKKAFSDLFKS